MSSWSFEGLHNADPLLGLAIVMLIGVVAADVLHRTARLPRVVGLMLVGALAGPLALRAGVNAQLDPWKPLLDLAIGVLVFELGTRIRPRWLLDNAWLALADVLEAVLAGAAVVVALAWLGASPRAAALAGVVAMSTSPVVIMAMVNELKPRGQVAERLLLATALNSALAVLLLKGWRVVAAFGWPSPGNEWLSVGASAVYVVCGSFLLGAAAGWALHRLARGIRAPAGTTSVLQIALVIVASLLAVQWKLSPLLALLVAGVMARSLMGHRLTVEPHMGSAGAVLTVLLFISLGLLSSFDGLMALWPWVLVIVGARLAGKAVAVLATARVSGLGWRQALALTLGLQPMSSLAVLLAADTFGWPSQLPGVEAAMLQSLLLATALMQLVGPLLTQAALRRVVHESEDVHVLATA